MGYFPVKYNSRVVIFERKFFIRLATGNARLAISTLQQKRETSLDWIVAPFANCCFLILKVKRILPEGLHLQSDAEIKSSPIFPKVAPKISPIFGLLL